MLLLIASLCIIIYYHYIHSYTYIIEDRKTERQKDRKTERQKDRKIIFVDDNAVVVFTVVLRLSFLSFLFLLLLLLL